MENINMYDYIEIWIKFIIRCWNSSNLKNYLNYWHFYRQCHLRGKQIIFKSRELAFPEHLKAINFSKFGKT